jgi:hypothetical protein
MRQTPLAGSRVLPGTLVTLYLDWSGGQTAAVTSPPVTQGQMEAGASPPITAGRAAAVTPQPVPTEPFEPWPAAVLATVGGFALLLIVGLFVIMALIRVARPGPRTGRSPGPAQRQQPQPVHVDVQARTRARASRRPGSGWTPTPTGPYSQ